MHPVVGSSTGAPDIPSSRRRETASSTVVDGVKVAIEERGVMQEETTRRLFWEGVPTKTRSLLTEALNALVMTSTELTRRIWIRTVGFILFIAAVLYESFVTFMTLKF